MNAPTTSDQAEELVKAAYELILLRTPDPPGGKAATDNLLNGAADLQALFFSLLQSDEFAVNLPRFIQRYVRPERQPLLLDHTQNGEFKYILQFLMTRGQKNQVIVDVGARGRDRSNSYDLLKHFGWQGLLVEANPALHAGIREAFAGTRFELENAAVSDYEGSADFYFGVNDDVSSLNRKAAAGWGDIQGQIRVVVHRLETLLDRHAIPVDFDILSLDIEGEDVKSLNKLIDASKYRPRLVIIEIGDLAAGGDLAAIGFSGGVRQLYKYFAHCGPNLFLTRAP